MIWNRMNHAMHLKKRKKIVNYDNTWMPVNIEQTAIFFLKLKCKRTMDCLKYRTYKRIPLSTELKFKYRTYKNA